MKIGNLEVYGIIYKITNIVNGKVYIGQTTNERGFNGRYNSKGVGIERVYNHYLGRKLKGWDFNDHLLKSIEKYGLDNFKVCEVFDTAFSQEELNIKEIVYIKLYKSRDDRFGYNKADGGDNGNGISGKEHFRTKPIYCITTNKMFDTLREAGKFYNIHPNMITMNLNGAINRIVIDGVNTIWRYYDDYLNMTEKEIEELKYRATDEYHHKRLRETHKNEERFKKVVCLTTGEIFNSCKEAIEKYDAKNLSKCLTGKIKHCGCHPITGEKLEWEYYKK